ncbi:MAG TPA: hypothetical protein VJS68_01325, partial [Thermoplasmata archaeon]|nr:hypothetical protein [Thermoplasmata archaeon]
EIHIQLYRDSAVVHSRFMQKASLDGKEWNGEFLVSDAWVHDRGDWRVACRHMSKPSGVRTKGQLGEPQ